MIILRDTSPPPGSDCDQAACDSVRIGNSGSRDAGWAVWSMSNAMSRQLPQLAPAPVRMVSSATVVQPEAAASRIWWSVMPLQMQTYTVALETRQARNGPTPFHPK